MAIRCGKKIAGIFAALLLNPALTYAQEAVSVIEHVNIIDVTSGEALMEEAKRLDLKVIGHIPMTVTPSEASASGFSVEHVNTLFEGTFSNGIEFAELSAAIRAFREAEANDLFREFVVNGTSLTPTLQAFRFLLDFDEILNDETLRYMAKSHRDDLAQNPPVPQEQLPLIRSLYKEFLETTRMLHESGVKLLAGTDLSLLRVPGYSLHKELTNLESAGLSPLAALQTATINPAVHHGLEDDFGSIATGKIANLVMLTANPLDSIANTLTIQDVFYRGNHFSRNEIDVLLETGAEQADNL